MSAEGFTWALVQSRRVVKHLVARISNEAAEHWTQQLFRRKLTIFTDSEVQFEVFGADRVELGADVDEEVLQTFFDLHLVFFWFPRQFWSSAFEFFFYLSKGIAAGVSVSILHLYWFKSSENSAFIS